MSTIADRIEHRIHIKKYEPACWYSEQGAYKLYNQFLKKGLPNIAKWKFITLTIDPNKYYDEEHCYQVGNRHLRQFLYLLRKEYGYFEFMKKVEFHKNGYAHWHLLVSIKEKVDIAFVRKAWGKGRIDVEYVRKSHCQKALDYLFKYACKSQDLPDWVLCKKAFRFVAFSEGFFTNNFVECSHGVPSSTVEESNQGNKEAGRLKTIKERIENWERSAIISLRTAKAVLYNRIGFKEGCTWTNFLRTALNLKIYNNAINAGQDLGVYLKEVFMSHLSHFVTFIDENLLEVPQILEREFATNLKTYKETPLMAYPF